MTDDADAHAQAQKAWKRFATKPQPGKRLVTLGTWFARSAALKCPVWVGKTVAAQFGPVAKEIAERGGVDGLLTVNRAPSIQNAAALRTKQFPPVRYVVHRYIAEGCTLFAGRPKVGKSWLMLHAALAVASGTEFLGILEDNERRLHSRISKLFGAFNEWPKNLEYSTEWSRAHEGGLEKIRDWIDTHPQARLIVVDVLARIRAPRSHGQPLYESDYEAIAALQKIAVLSRMWLEIGAARFPET